jgi:hypothetical protein
MPAFVSPDNIQKTALQSQTFAVGETRQIPTAGAIPTGRRVRSVVFRLDVDITQPAAGQTAQNGGVLHRLLAQVRIGRRVSMTGWGMVILNWMMNGFLTNMPPGFPATANGVFSRSIEWTLNYADPSCRTPDDGAIPAELWTDPIEVQFGTAAIFGAVVPTTITGTLRTFVVHDCASVAKNGKRITIPQSINMQTDDFSALTAQLNKPGMWAYLGIFREVGVTAGVDNGQITSAQVSNVIVNIDGMPVVNSLRGQDMATLFNRIRAATGALRNENNNGVAGTLPIPGTATNVAPPGMFPGSSINDMPGAATAAGQGVVMDFVPLIFPPRNYHASMLARAKVGARVDLAGTITLYKAVYRIVERRPDQAIGNAARRLGIIKGQYQPKPDAAKASLMDDPELAPYLPASVYEG